MNTTTIKPIRNEQDYQATLARIEQLMEAMPNTPEFDELDILTTLVEAYEEKYYPIALPNPIDAIKFRMEQLGLKESDLKPYIGSQSKVSEILSNKQALSKPMIDSLHQGLNIPLEVLIQPYPLKENKYKTNTIFYMKNIIIKLSPEIALKYQQISDQDKENIEKQIENMIDLEIEKIKKKASDNLSKLMDQASEEAQTNGLTPEILEEILSQNQ